jgi:hypothetical protein
VLGETQTVEIHPKRLNLDHQSDEDVDKKAQPTREGRSWTNAVKKIPKKCKC